MGDLISRKQLIREMMKWVGQVENGINTESLGMVIDRIPTAYDVDDVIEQLKTLETESKEMLIKCSENGDVREIDKYFWVRSAFLDAIEIVRKGGGV